MPPPRLSAASAERMAAVATTADSLVDSGVDPNAAIAKAAQDHGLPHNHLDIVVRAFNTARAVRQYGEETPWAKAANHPTASAEAVRAILIAPPETKTAADISDYLTPPAKSAWVPYEREIPRLTEPRPVSTAIKAANEVKVATTAPRRDSRLSLERDAAQAYDAAALTIVPLPPRQYAAVKEAATSLVPEVAAFFFPRIEAEYVSLVKRAGQNFEPDPTVTIDHYGVQLLHRLAMIKAAYVAPEEEQTPYGYENISLADGLPFYRKLPTCPIFGTPLQKAAAAVPPPQPPQNPFGFSEPTDEKLASVVEKVKEASALNSGLSSFMNTATMVPKALAGNRLTAPAFDMSMPYAKTNPSIQARRLGAATDDLSSDFHRVDTQAALQDVLTDPRFSQADPRTLVETYRSLQSLAPMAMANKSIASDFLHRTMQTGPPSYFDLSKLVEMEKHLSAIKKDSRPDPTEPED